MRRAFFSTMAALWLTAVVAGSFSMAAGKIPDVTRESFNDMVLKSSVPVIVQFHATWCGFCKKQAPSLQRLYDSGAMGVSIVKVDVDRYPDIMTTYKVRTLPTFVAMHQGYEVDRAAGFQEEDVLKAWTAEVAHLAAAVDDMPAAP